MKLSLALVLLGLGVALTSPVTENTPHYKTADGPFLDKQVKVLSLFKHIQQPTHLDEHVKILEGVTDPVQWLQQSKSMFEKTEVVEKLIEFFHNDYMLPKGKPFSVMYEQHLEQAIALFELFYYAKDFETFYYTAIVMRHFVNEGMFLYSASVAIVHRQDTYGIILPPIYEVYPWYFFNSEVIHEAYKTKMMHMESQKNTAESHHHIYANYSGNYLNLHWEQQSLSYFMEDIGINSFVYYFHLHYPFWMSGEEYHLKNDYRGEMFLATMQALVARYYMERLSNGEGQIPFIDWNVPFETPFYPSLQYPNGLPFTERPKFADLHDYFYQYGQHINSPYAFSRSFIETFERRMFDAIDSGVVWNTHEKKMGSIYDPKKNNEYVNRFGNMLQSNADSVNRQLYRPYLMFASHLLGYSLTPTSWKSVAPSALQHHETFMRDPASYQLMKKALIFYHQFQATHMKPYEKTELIFPGVSIDKVEMDRLITYFDEFHADISNAVYDNEEELKEDTFQVFAVQKRMNHKPFTYKIYVNSNQETDAMVKVFIGPKYDEYDRYINITENRWNFVPIDAFKWHLTSGQNVIKRSSQDSQYYSHDKTSYMDLYKKVMGAHKGQSEFHVTGKENYFYFPDRMMLPMGSFNGVPYQFYFIVYPFKDYVGMKSDLTYFYPRPGTGGGYVDDLPIYYPLDRPIKYGKMFTTEIPNSYFYETKIYHRTADEAQVVQPAHSSH